MTTISDPAKSPGIRWLVLFGVWLLYFSFGLGIASLAPLIAPITRDLDMSNTAMGSVLGSWQLIYIFVAIPCGLLIARYGARRMLIAGALIIALSGFCRSIAVNYPTMLLAVALFGFGGPIVSAGAPQVAASWFKGSERGLAMGIYISGPGVAGLIVLITTNSLLMPWFDDNWRMVLQLWAAGAVLAGIVWTLIFLHPDVRRQERAQVKETKIPGLDDLASLFRIPGFAIVLAMSICVFIYTHGLRNWLPEMLRVGGMSAVDAGFWSALPVVVGTLGALIIPRFATPERRTKVMFALLAGAVISGFTLSYPAGFILSTGLILQGLVYASLMTITLLMLLELPGVGENRAGMASGVFFSVAEVGGVTGPLMLGALYDATGDFTAGRAMLIINAFVMIGLIVWLLRIRNRAMS